MGFGRDFNKTENNLLDIINPQIKQSGLVRHQTREYSIFDKSLGTRLNLLSSEAPEAPIQYQNISKYHPLIIKLKLKTLFCKKSPKKKCSPKDLLSSDEIDILQRGWGVKKPVKKPVKKTKPVKKPV